MLTKRQMLEALDGLLNKCEAIHSDFRKDHVTWTPSFASWLKAAESTIEVIFGSRSAALTSFQRIYFLPPPGTQNAEATHAKLLWFDSGLRYAHASLVGLHYSVEKLANENPTSSNPNIFISHGGPTRTHVDATKDLLKELGLSPVVVCDLPNYNMSLNEKVLHYMRLCAGAVILATVEDETTTREERARPNVENEVGALQTSPSIANRIVYLKEPEVQFASNYKEKAWIPFQKETVETAFVHVIRELRAFGFLT